MNKIELLAEIIKKSNDIVFFGGAGVSTESNIPDFRTSNNLNIVKEQVASLKDTAFTQEELLSHTFFINYPKLFFDYYFNALVHKEALPNFAHKFLVKLENNNKLKAVVTQNIDGLHQQAGSTKVFELHGSIHRNYCTKCKSFYNLDDMILNNATCPKCKSIIKPDVVLYEEQLDATCIEKAINAIVGSDCLIVGGTSLVVYPAASFVRYFRGRHLVIINKEQTPYDKFATLVINDKIGEVFKEVNKILKY